MTTKDIREQHMSRHPAAESDKSLDELIARAQSCRFDVPSTCAGVYFLFRDDMLVYVGMSKRNVFARVARHADEGLFPFDSCSVLAVSDGVDIDDLEARLIFRFRPEFNRHVSGQSCDGLSISKKFLPRNTRKKLRGAPAMYPQSRVSGADAEDAFDRWKAERAKAAG